MRPSAAAGFVQAPIHAGTLHLSASPVVSATTRFGRNRPRPSDDDESMMNYLARSEAKRGPSSTSTGFGRPNQRYPHDLARGRTDGIDPPAKKYIEYDWCSVDEMNKDRIKTMISERTMSTALCIIPPDAAWDTIQRARYKARDNTYHRWPPAIRLFHPFVPRRQLPNAATSIADVIEKHGIEPFDITLNSLLILPHFEILDEQLNAEAGMNRRQTVEETRMSAEEERRKESQEQIEDEARRSTDQKLRRRGPKPKPKAAVTKKTQIEAGSDPASVLASASTSDDSTNLGSSQRGLSPQDLLNKQRQQREEFNGPCVVCLEPCRESRKKLANLREILRRELFSAYDPFSVSSSVSSTQRLPRSVQEKHKRLSKGIKAKVEDGATFRSALTLARFTSVTSAVKFATMLQETWEPLTFSITDLSLISRTDPEGPPSDMYDNKDAELNIRRIQGTEFESESEILSTKGRYGCDALVALLGADEFAGENIRRDKEVLDLLFSEAGKAGGAGKDMDYETLLSTSEEEEDLQRRQARVRYDGINVLNDYPDENDEVDWDELLMDDDEWDEGATVIIGRTQFFTGEARQYVGMPAMSATDAKDRVHLGDGVGATVRRKGTVHRKGERWNEGDFGRKEGDWTEKK